MTGHGITLDEYIAKLQKLREKHGGDVECFTQGGDYPEGASGPHVKEKDDGYTRKGAVVLS